MILVKVGVKKLEVQAKSRKYTKKSCRRKGKVDLIEEKCDQNKKTPLIAESEKLGKIVIFEKCDKNF